MGGGGVARRLGPKRLLMTCEKSGPLWRGAGLMSVRRGVATTEEVEREGLGGNEGENAGRNQGRGLEI
ncbi:MAG: hypothetical protein H7210_07795 [Pyrinomonadaceae bacterium]|nr:hypothetical protein [Phycisphaerales bacterium]